MLDKSLTHNDDAFPQAPMAVYGYPLHAFTPHAGQQVYRAYLNGAAEALLRSSAAAEALPTT